MNKYLPTIVITISGALIITLLVMRGCLPPVPRSPKYEIIRRTVPSYRCRLCTPHGNLCPDNENIRSFDDSHAANFHPVVRSKFKDAHIFGFETDNLRFREARKDDVDAMNRYARKPIVAARTVWAPHKTKLETARVIDGWLSQYDQLGIAPWVIEEKKSGTLVGSAGFNAMYPSEPRTFFSYCLSDEAWGNEYEVEVVRALIEIGMTKMGCIRVETVVRSDFPFGHRVLEQAGMSCEGDEPDYKRVGTEFVSMKHYAILRKDVLTNLKRSIFYQ